MAHNIYSDISPTDTYVIYDQFHFGCPDHLEERVKGWDNALSRYCFTKTFNSNLSLGLSTAEYYDHLRSGKRHTL